VLFGVQAIKSIATYDVAVERLRQRFHLGLVAPGSKLPPERRLAEEMHVARATLREALRVLAADGYIEIRRGVAGGAVVPDRDSFVQIISKRAKGDLVARYRALEFWEITQVAAAPLAAERCTPAHLKRLRLVAERLAHAPDAWQRRSAEVEFCLSVGAASGNSWLANALYDSLAAAFLPFAECNGTGSEFDAASMKALIDSMERSVPVEAKHQMALIAATYANRLRPKRRNLQAGAAKEDSQRLMALGKDQPARTG
jgi:GntR family transcriptional repressor for pyruvate dehydrogenase complex